jgi:hypothetical protein
VAARLSELGAWAFSNDEAWVALSTRVDGVGQWWLAISTTPVAWAGLVKLVSLVSSHEAALRAIPFLFGCLTMVVAFLLGRRVAGHPLGGVLALAAVAFDPLAIAYAKNLKQYTAEAFFCLLAVERTVAFGEHPGRRPLVLLALVLVAGLGFTNSQLVVAPATFGALLLDAALRRDGRMLRDVAIAAAGVGVCAGLFFWLVVFPRMPPASNEYWGRQVYVPIARDALAVAWRGIAWTLTRALGAPLAPLALVCLALTAVSRRARVAAAVLVFLVLETIGLSMLRIVTVSQPRILLFLTTALVTLAAASVGLAVVRAWHRPIAGIVAVAALALVVYDFARTRAWRELGRPMSLEDAGPLVRRIEKERRPGDVVLVHRGTGFVFAFYQTATPVLVPSKVVAVGYVPSPPDPSVTFVDDREVEARARAAMDRGARVWFVASRLRAPRERRMREALARVGAATLHARRHSAFLLLVQRTDRMQ